MCKVNPDLRAQRSPENNCIQCHMPRSETEIPHLAFTHHRIGVHTSAETRATDPESMPQGLGVLVPFRSLSFLPEKEQQRLGRAGLSGNRQSPARRRDWAEIPLARGRAAAAGPRQGPSGWAGGTALARLAFDLQKPGGETFTHTALQDPQLSGQDRCTVLFLLADAAVNQGRYAGACRMSTNWSRCGAIPPTG